MQHIDGFNLAIETSSREGSVSIGRGDELLDSAPILEPKRHSLELMPTIDQLCSKHGAAAKDIKQIYVAIGPGSFTGLRIAISTAKMLSHTLGVELCGVPSVEVLAQNVPISDTPLCVGVNMKKDSIYGCIFEARENIWVYRTEAKLHTMDELLGLEDGELNLLGSPLPELPEGYTGKTTLLPEFLAKPNSQNLWMVGRRYAKAGQILESAELLPIYARIPEAVELWNKRHDKVS